MVPGLDDVGRKRGGTPRGEESVRLMFAMRYSSEVERMTAFYRDSLAIGTASESPYFVEFKTGMTSYALLAIHPGETVHFELCFAVDDIDASIAEMRARSMEFTDEMREQPFGKLIHMRDPDGNVVTLLQPSRPSASKGEPHLAALIINTWDFGRTVMFYRDRLGLPVLAETPRRVEFGTDGARITVHARAERPDAPAHTKQKIACAFEVADLEAWASKMEARGTPLVTEPTEEAFGLYAEVIDPDGGLVVFREPASVIPPPAVAAKDFEDDRTPRRSGIRKPLKKRSKAVSRVAMKPQYKEKAKPRRTPAAASTNGKSSENGTHAKKTVRAKTVRSAKPARTRVALRSAAVGRSKAKSATERPRKSERRTIETRKRAVASKRPVKRVATAGSGR